MVALVNSIAEGSPNQNGFTTSAVDMTGANLIVIEVVNSSAFPPSDNQSNTYTLVTQNNTVADNQLFYSLNPAVSASMTWTLGGTGTFSGLVVMGFSGIATSAALDQSNNASAAGSSTVNPGSITPSGNGYLVTSGATLNGVQGYVLAIDSSFSTPVSAPEANGLCGGSALSYLVQSTAAAVNPTWSGTSSPQYTGATIASFAPAAGTFVSAGATIAGQGSVPRALINLGGSPTVTQASRRAAFY